MQPPLLLPQGRPTPTGLRDTLTARQQGPGDFQGGPLLRTSWKGLEADLLTHERSNPSPAECLETCESVQVWPRFPSLIQRSTCVQSHLYQLALWTATASPPGPSPPALSHHHRPSAPRSQQPWASSRPCPNPLPHLERPRPPDTPFAALASVPLSQQPGDNRPFHLLGEKWVPGKP